jgi:hypothetical protein
MVSGSSLVLYSRLHLVFLNPKALRIVFLIILGNAIILQIPNIIIAYMPEKFTPAEFGRIGTVFTYIVIIFSIQEISISSLYVYPFIRFMRQGGSLLTPKAKRMLYFLVVMEALVIMSDVLLSTLVFLHLYSARRMIIGFVYAIKLRIELAVLNRIIGFRLVGAQLEGEGVGAGSGLRNVVTVRRGFQNSLQQLAKGSDSIGSILVAQSLTGREVLDVEREREVSVLPEILDGNGIQTNPLDVSHPEIL